MGGVHADLRISRRIQTVKTTGTGQEQTAEGAADASGTARPDPLIGLLFDGRYRVQSRMARGGMASVYIANDERLDRQVAVKVMHPHLAESEQFTARFQREARAAAKISHPGVIPVYDQGVFQGRGYLVMELVDGPDLRAYLAEQGPITLAQALGFTAEILQALAAAHHVGVVHRDLKPENVLVASSGTLKLVDFGLARAMSDTSLSTTGSVLGTVTYLAPEVALRGESDSRTDLYASGIMLYEMLTGAVPQADGSPIQIAYARVNEDVPSPSLSVPWLPQEVDDLVASLCARDPQHRPGSVGEAVRLIEKVEQSVPGDLLNRALPPPAPSLVAPVAADQTRAVAAPGRTAHLPVHGQLIRTSGSNVAPDQKQSPSRSKIPMILASLIMLVVAAGLGTWWWWQQYGPGAYSELPSLVGMTQEQAVAELTDLRLASVIVTDNSDTVPEGDVISTLPEAGASVHRNDEVEVRVSLGVLMLEVPAVEELPVRQAEKALERVGLAVGDQDEEWSETVRSGSVITSAPTPGTLVQHDTNVNLIVSKGPEPIALPDLLGQLEDQAIQAVEALGLQAERAEEYSTTYEAGQIAAQSPEAGTKLHRGETVTLTVSLGPEYVEVPDVYRMSSEEATQVLQEAGFEVEVSWLAGFFDTVGSQEPAAGSQAIKGSTVKISVV